MVFPATIKGDYMERMTDEEFFHFCHENRELKFERSATGEIIAMSPATYISGKRNNEILFQLNKWNKALKWGETIDSDTGFCLPNGAMRSPDAAWISNQRLKSIETKEFDRFPHLVPDFIVERKSKSDRLHDLKEKMNEWMSYGCRLGWLIDADGEIVYIYEGNQERIHTGFDTDLSGEPVLSGFTFVLSELRV